ncbi:MAG: hypothetical protein ACOYXU_03080 [Nitrospirota bacterium]
MSYTRVIWGYRARKDDDSLYLAPSEISHLDRVYKRYGIVPESVDYVCVEFLLQREKLARYIIKELDVVLKIGGLFEVVIMDSKSHSSYTRSRDQVKYEMAISTNGRYRHTGVTRSQRDRVLKLSYRKTAATLPEGDSIDKWSFGIITNGKKPEQVEALVESIVQQNIPEREILVCGPFAGAHPYKDLKVLDDVVLVDDVRAPICAKKNRIINASRYNNLCILHDRFRLPRDWHARFRQYGNFFDFLCLPTVDEGGRRFRVDWMCFCDPITRTLVRNRALPYSRWSAGQIIQGGVILGKKHLMADYGLDERLHWEELEDMHFSKMAYLDGAFMNIDVNNCIVSKAVNHQAARHGEAYMAFREWTSWLLGVVVNFMKFHLYIRLYGSPGRG